MRGVARSSGARPLLTLPGDAYWLFATRSRGDTMNTSEDTRDAGKRAAARHAVQGLPEGVRLALGTGSTVEAAIPLLAQVPGLTATPTSDVIEAVARDAGLELVPIREEFDLYLDGADQVAPDGSVLKGSWGAHVREKTLAELSRRRVLLCDESKLVDRISGRVPVAVLPYVAHLWDEHEVLKIDENGLVVVLVDYDGRDDPAAWDAEVSRRPGVHSTGIYPASLVDEIVVGTADGAVEVRTATATAGAR